MSLVVLLSRLAEPPLHIWTQLRLMGVELEVPGTGGSSIVSASDFGARSDVSGGGNGESGLLKLGGAELQTFSSSPLVLESQPNQPGPPFVFASVVLSSACEGSLTVNSAGFGVSKVLSLLSFASRSLPCLS